MPKNFLRFGLVIPPIYEGRYLYRVMKFEEFKKFEYCCQDTQELLLLYVVYPEELTFDERTEADKHLARCSVCRDDYEGMKLISDMLRANRDYLRNSGVFGNIQSGQPSVEMSHEEIMEMKFQARLTRASARRKRRERKQRIAKFKRIAKPISAVVACIIAVLGICLITNQLTPANDNTSTIAAILHETPVKIELLTAFASKIIQAGQPIIATNAPKTLRINNNRRMNLNPNTELSIISHNLGCIVKLVKGEIDTQVDHDGKPFIVETTHGRAIIIGTTFNIKTNDRQMVLTVTEGTVRFASEEGFVNVSAGYRSEIAANSLPTMPVNLAGFGNTKQRVIAADAILEAISIPIMQAPPVLENIDYEAWVEENRDWFKREFPHIFHIKEALAKDGIETDYPELLIKSGDLLRFMYPPVSSTKLISPDPAVLIQLAVSYSKDQEWLNLTLPTINFASNTTTSSDTLRTNVAMFNKWLTLIREANKSGNFSTSGIVMDSLHASIYLTKTRTLTWLTTAQTNPDAKEQNLLADEIATTYKLTTQTIQLMKSEGNTCQSDQPELLQEAIESINKIIEIERNFNKLNLTDPDSQIMKTRKGFVQASMARRL